MVSRACLGYLQQFSVLMAKSHGIMGVKSVSLSLNVFVANLSCSNGFDLLFRNKEKVLTVHEGSLNEKLKFIVSVFYTRFCRIK